MTVFVVGFARVQESVDVLFVFKIPTVTALSCKKLVPLTVIEMYSAIVILRRVMLNVLGGMHGRHPST